MVHKLKNMSFGMHCIEQAINNYDNRYMINTNGNYNIDLLLGIIHKMQSIELNTNKKNKKATKRMRTQNANYPN